MARLSELLEFADKPDNCNILENVMRHLTEAYNCLRDTGKAEKIDSFVGGMSERDVICLDYILLNLSTTTTKTPDNAKEYLREYTLKKRLNTFLNVLAYVKADDGKHSAKAKNRDEIGLAIAALLYDIGMFNVEGEEFKVEKEGYKKVEDIILDGDTLSKDGRIKLKEQIERNTTEMIEKSDLSSFTKKVIYQLYGKLKDYERSDEKIIKYAVIIETIERLGALSFPRPRKEIRPVSKEKICEMYGDKPDAAKQAIKGVLERRGLYFPGSPLYLGVFREVLVIGINQDKDKSNISRPIVFVPRGFVGDGKSEKKYEMDLTNERLVVEKETTRQLGEAEKAKLSYYLGEYLKLGDEKYAAFLRNKPWNNLR